MLSRNGELSATEYHSLVRSFCDVRVVERKRPVTVLTVFTGELSHKVRTFAMHDLFCSSYRYLGHCDSRKTIVFVV